jgi:hypothetical protein
MNEHELIDVTSFAAARIVLAERGIQFDRAAQVMIVDTDGRSRRRGPQIYFMRGNADVAFYTPIVGVLLIQAQPREWAAEFAAALVNI